MIVRVRPLPRKRAAIRGCTCGRLRRLTRRVTSVYDRALAPCGLRVTQYSLMSTLLTLRTAALSVLADALDMDRTTLLRNLRPLMESGLVREARSANSRRIEVSLTPAGRAKWSEAEPLWRLAQSAIGSVLGDSEVARLHRRIDRCLARLRSAQAEERQ